MDAIGIRSGEGRLDGTSPLFRGYGRLRLLEISKTHAHNQLPSQNNRLADRGLILHDGFARRMVNTE
jgi:hypothetical protein